MLLHLIHALFQKETSGAVANLVLKEDMVVLGW